ncbi:Esophageal gland-localized secretory protein 12 [Aphelenchoides bicaudatus]|nr:Esophageal gland-localized secretory protein 12 [Aphelenchoides bicaudatus]
MSSNGMSLIKMLLPLLFLATATANFQIPQDEKVTVEQDGEVRHKSPFHADFHGVISEHEIRWPEALPPKKDELINRADCYQELSHAHMNFTIAVPNDGQLEYRPCMIRIPPQTQIEFVHMNLTNKLSNIKVVAGKSMDHAPLKVAYVNQKSSLRRYGPYYVPCNWAYVIFESRTRTVRETIYFRITPVDPDLDVASLELDFADRCAARTRNYLGHVFYRAVTPKPPHKSRDEVADPSYNFRPHRYQERMEVDGGDM